MSTTEEQTEINKGCPTAWGHECSSICLKCVWTNYSQFVEVRGGKQTANNTAQLIDFYSYEMCDTTIVTPSRFIPAK